MHLGKLLASDCFQDSGSIVSDRVNSAFVNQLDIDPDLGSGYVSSCPKSVARL